MWLRLEPFVSIFVQWWPARRVWWWGGCRSVRTGTSSTANAWAWGARPSRQTSTRWVHQPLPVCHNTVRDRVLSMRTDGHNRQQPSSDRHASTLEVQRSTATDHVFRASMQHYRTVRHRTTNKGAGAEGRGSDGLHKFGACSTCTSRLTLGPHTCGPHAQTGPLAPCLCPRNARPVHPSAHATHARLDRRPLASCDRTTPGIQHLRRPLDPASGDERLLRQPHTLTHIHPLVHMHHHHHHHPRCRTSPRTPRSSCWWRRTPPCPTRPPANTH